MTWIGYTFIENFQIKDRKVGTVRKRKEYEQFLLSLSVKNKKEKNKKQRKWNTFF